MDVLTNNEIKTICVFSSSSQDLDEVYIAAARKTGELMGKNGYNLVYGGGRLGLMYANAKAVKDFGGKVLGVIPQKLYDVGLSSDVCDEVIVTEEMRSRKSRMDKEADAVIALAGGFGTLEELSEMIVQKQLGYNTKPVVILNTNGFYNHLVEFFEDIIKNKFANSEVREVYYVAQTPEDAISYLKNYSPKHFDVYQKLKL